MLSVPAPRPARSKKVCSPPDVVSERNVFAVWIFGSRFRRIAPFETSLSNTHDTLLSSAPALDSSCWHKRQTVKGNRAVNNKRDCIIAWRCGATHRKECRELFGEVHVSDMGMQHSVLWVQSAHHLHGRLRHRQWLASLRQAMLSW